MELLTTYWFLWFFGLIALIFGVAIPTVFHMTLRHRFIEFVGLIGMFVEVSKYFLYLQAFMWLLFVTMSILRFFWFSLVFGN